MTSIKDDYSRIITQAIQSISESKKEAKKYPYHALKQEIRRYVLAGADKILAEKVKSGELKLIQTINTEAYETGTTKDTE